MDKASPIISACQFNSIHLHQDAQLITPFSRRSQQHHHQHSISEISINLQVLLGAGIFTANALAKQRQLGSIRSLLGMQRRTRFRAHYHHLSLHMKSYLRMAQNFLHSIRRVDDFPRAGHDHQKSVQSLLDKTHKPKKRKPNLVNKKRKQPNERQFYNNFISITNEINHHN